MARASSEDRGTRRTDIAHAAMRGAVAAMCMSGLRVLSTSLGLLDKTPPEMITAERAPRLFRDLPEGSRDAVVVLMHWSYGALGGAVFGALPPRIRRATAAGPVYGLGLWLAFEALLTPALGLEFSRRRTASERLALAADHVLYGAVLSELRRAPRR